MNRRQLGAVLTVALLAGCRLPAPGPSPPAVAFDGPLRAHEVEVNVASVLREGRSGPVLAIAGEARNDGAEDLAEVRVVFELLDATDVKVGDAVAVTPGLRADQIWRFDAPATVALRGVVARVRVDRVELLTASGRRLDFESNAPR